MKYYKSIIGGYATAIAKREGTHWSVINISDGLELSEIDEAEYNAVLAVVNAKPFAEAGYIYMLRASDLEWELVELPPMPEPDLTPEEALEILLGGDGT